VSRVAEEDGKAKGKNSAQNFATEMDELPVPQQLVWLKSAFNTRSHTEQLLRPELENGLITQHDFDAAVDFFP
jgi:hypothetical protein